MAARRPFGVFCSVHLTRWSQFTRKTKLWFTMYDLFRKADGGKNKDIHRSQFTKKKHHNSARTFMENGTEEIMSCLHTHTLSRQFDKIPEISHNLVQSSLIMLVCFTRKCQQITECTPTQRTSREDNATVRNKEQFRP